MARDQQFVVLHGLAVRLASILAADRRAAPCSAPALRDVVGNADNMSVAMTAPQI
jgi:hypothetical protein